MTEIIPSEHRSILYNAGQAANQAAAETTFQRYQRELADNTLIAHRNDLSDFLQFLQSKGLMEHYPDDALYEFVGAWKGITFGLVEAYKEDMLNYGYAIATINRRIDIIKKYAELAFKAGVIPQGDYVYIKVIDRIRRKAGKRIDERREKTRVQIKGAKKERHTPIPIAVAKHLKYDFYPPTPLGRRNRLIMNLLIDLGLRVSELVILEIGDLKFDEGLIDIYRPKTDLQQTHNLTTDLFKAIKACRDYSEVLTVYTDPLIRRAYKGGSLGNTPISIRAVQKLVKETGEALDIKKLSPHDFRHFWATQVAQQVRDGKIDLLRFQEAGGWTNLNTARLYVDESEIANDGIISV